MAKLTYEEATRVETTFAVYQPPSVEEMERGAVSFRCLGFFTDRSEAEACAWNAKGPYHCEVERKLWGNNL